MKVFQVNVAWLKSDLSLADLEAKMGLKAMSFRERHSDLCEASFGVCGGHSGALAAVSKALSAVSDGDVTVIKAG